MIRLMVIALLLSCGIAQAQECSANDPTRFSIHSNCLDAAHNAPKWTAERGLEVLRACVRMGYTRGTPGPDYRGYCIAPTPRYTLVPID
jgi:hypothetical protein